MNSLRLSFNTFCHKSSFMKNYVSLPLSFLRKFSDEAESPKFSMEKSINHVTLLGRVGSVPQLRGTENKPVVLFTLATNTNYKYDSGEIQQKTEWHRISVFKPHLRKIVLDYLRKGSRVYIDGRLMYGEFADSSGTTHSTTSIVANDIISFSTARKDGTEGLTLKEDTDYSL